MFVGVGEFVLLRVILAQLRSPGDPDADPSGEDGQPLSVNNERWCGHWTHCNLLMNSCVRWFGPSGFSLVELGGQQGETSHSPTCVAAVGVAATAGRLTAGLFIQCRGYLYPVSGGCTCYGAGTCPHPHPHPASVQPSVHVRIASSGREPMECWRRSCTSC